MSFAAADLSALGVAERYDALEAELEAVLEGEPDAVANLANAAALIFHGLPGLNWAGFYLMKRGELVLGPFQGRVACVRIPVGRGVCGTAVSQRRTLRVDDVHAFPGHIACDAASRSELVVPMFAGREVVGVLDLDAPTPARFTDEDALACERLAAIIMRHVRLQAERR
jgi:GAF domain-containing protein